jgi:hypothetical protein
MAFQLIPLLSILFALVLGLACMAILWQLRRTGKIYSILFKACTIAEIILLVIFSYEIIANMH